MTSATGRGIALALLAVLTACVGGRGGGPEAERTRAGAETVSVEVTNYNWRDMHVYVLAAGQRFSLGIVATQRSEMYELPPGVLAADRELVLMADPVGSSLAYLSEPILVQAGDVVEWRLQNRLPQSGIFVR